MNIRVIAAIDNLDNLNAIMESISRPNQPTPSLRLSFSSSLTVGDVEKQLANSEHVPSNIPDLLELDFSDCTFVEVASLVFLLSVLADRQRKHFPTSIRLPRNKKVRDFLRTWNFPETIRDVTGVSFWRIVDQRDHHYFGENSDVRQQKYAGVVREVDGFWNRELSDKFFGLSAFIPKESSFNAALALDVASKWKRQIVTSVLSNVLQGPEGFFASRIVFEAVANAIRHPQASTIVTGSHFDVQAGHKNKGYFTVTFWDDGESIVDTLRSALDNDQVISSLLNNTFDDIYLVKTICSDAENTIQLLRSDYLPDKNTRDELLFLSSIMPGITRDPGGKGHVSNPDSIVDEDSLLKMPGMGLYLLVNAAINVYKGSVAIRTKELFMNIKKAKNNSSNAQYSVKINLEMPRFLGNMVTVRLPLISDVA